LIQLYNRNELVGGYETYEKATDMANKLGITSPKYVDTDLEDNNQERKFLFIDSGGGHFDLRYIPKKSIVLRSWEGDLTWTNPGQLLIEVNLDTGDIEFKKSFQSIWDLQPVFEFIKSVIPEYFPEKRFTVVELK
jgi:hypothetical protein